MTWKAARLPFGAWFYLPRRALNLVRLSERPAGSWRPVQVSIALTARCGKGCEFCYADSTPAGTTAWTLENLLAVVDSCDRNGVFAVTFGGGEPLLWRDPCAGVDFYDLLRESSRFGCDISFTTSALPAVNWMRVPATVLPRLSLHHPDELPHILREIRRAHDQWQGVPAVNVLVRRGETRSILQVAEELEKSGVRDVLLLPLVAAGRAIGSDLVPGDEELNELVESFPIPGVKLSACRYLEDHDDAYLGCGAGDWFVSLDEQGRLRSCSFCPEKMPLENVDYRHIVEALPDLPRLPCHTRITVDPRD